MSNGITFGAGPFVDGTTYQGSNGVDYLYLNGCMVIAAAEDIDTVDGYSMPAVAPAGVVDSITGLPIEAGAPVTVFFDANGDISGYKDCTDMDTFGTLMTAASGFTDSAGNVIVAGDQYILLADGSTVGAEHTADTDTFAELIFAGSAGIDDAGNAYDAAAPLIMLANGDLVCVAKTIDTVGSITANQEGVGGGVGTASIMFPATSLTPATQKDNAVCGVQSNSVLDPITGLITTELNDESKLVSCEKQYKGLRDNNDGTKTEIFVNQDGDEVTGLTLDEPTQTGEPQLGSVLADGTTTYIDADGNSQAVPATDVNGNPVDPSQSVWNMIDGGGNYLGSKPCKDETVLSENQNGVVYSTNTATGNQVVPEVTVVQPSSAGTDSFGNDYAAGTEILVLGNNTTVCLGKVTSGTAAAGTKDAWGNDIPTGSSVLQLPNGDFVCIAENPVVKIECDLKTQLVTQKDGSSQRFRTAYKKQRGGYSLTENLLIDETNAAVDLVVTPEDDCYAITTSACGTEVIAESWTSYSLISAERSDNLQLLLAFTPQVSRDGGATWSSMQTGGGDQVLHAGGLVNEGEINYHDQRCYTQGANVTDTWCFRTILVAYTNLEPDIGFQVRVNTTQNTVSNLEEECC